MADDISTDSPQFKGFHECLQGLESLLKPTSVFEIRRLEEETRLAYRDENDGAEAAEGSEAAEQIDEAAETALVRFLFNEQEKTIDALRAPGNPPADDVLKIIEEFRAQIIETRLPCDQVSFAYEGVLRQGAETLGCLKDPKISEEQITAHLSRIALPKDTEKAEEDELQDARLFLLQLRNMEGNRDFIASCAQWVRAQFKKAGQEAVSGSPLDGEITHATNQAHIHSIDSRLNQLEWDVNVRLSPLTLRKELIEIHLQLDSVKVSDRGLASDFHNLIDRSGRQWLREVGVAETEIGELLHRPCPDWRGSRPLPSRIVTLLGCGT